jgi:hypothetical protein
MVRTDRGGLASESRADNPHGVESICRFAGRDAPRTPTARSGGVVDARKEGFIGRFAGTLLRACGGSMKIGLGARTNQKQDCPAHCRGITREETDR